MKKSPAAIIEVTKAHQTQPQDQAANVLEALLAEARALPPGSDVEAFMEQRLGDLTRAARVAVAQTRAQDQAAASREADSPPSAMPQLPDRHEARTHGTPPDADSVGHGKV